MTASATVMAENVARQGAQQFGGIALLSIESRDCELEVVNKDARRTEARIKERVRHSIKNYCSGLKVFFTKVSSFVKFQKLRITK